MQIQHWSVLVVMIFGSASIAAQPAAGSNDLIVSLYNQLETLQQEVQTLRGVVEEQGYQLKRLQTEQKDRYLDIDRRLSQMSPATPLTAGPTPLPAGTQVVASTGNSQDLSPSDLNAGAANSSVSEVPPAASIPASGGNLSAINAAPQDEQELYSTALNLLLEESKYDESIAMFQTYLDKFPQGRRLTNVLYWQGEAYLSVSGFAQASALFNRLLSQYPSDPKASGAMLKLGVVYKQMGDAAQAAATWRELKLKYPESVNDVNLAEQYLQAL
jgi:tol-pal system protein YbgF